MKLTRNTAVSHLPNPDPGRADWLNAELKLPELVHAGLVLASLTLLALWLSMAPAQAQIKGAGGRVGAVAESTDSIQKRVSVRFLTGKDYPPFNYLDEDNILTGFNVDMARAICLEMSAACDIKARSWNKLLPALKRGDADAVIASHVINAQTLRQVDFSHRYYYTPGRFISLRQTKKLTITPVGMEARVIGAVKGTTHAAYLRDFFLDSRIMYFANAFEARRALKTGKIELLFGDAISLSFWLNGTSANSCCEFRGGAFSEPKYFGDGVAIAIAKGDKQLQALINRALSRVRASGRYEELFLRYFPIRVY